MAKNNTGSWNISIYSYNKINWQSNLDFEKFSSGELSLESRCSRELSLSLSLSTWLLTKERWVRARILGWNDFHHLADCHHQHRVINLCALPRTFPILALGSPFLLPSPLPCHSQPRQTGAMGQPLDAWSGIRHWIFLGSSFLLCKTDRMD